MSLAQANNHLAVNLHRLLAEERRNVFFSPLSISCAMGMLLCAAEGDTESELRAALGHDQAGINKSDVASVFEKYMSDLLKRPDSYTLSCSNSLLSQKGFGIKDEYKIMLSESFKALVLEADFQIENQKAVSHINKWVKEKTKNMIPELIKSLDPNTVVLLLNAVYFKGTWLRKFKKRATFRQDFYNGGFESDAKKVDMMHMTNSFPFYQDYTMQVLQLPYVGKEVAMMVLLPRATDGLESVEAKLTPSFVQDLKKKLLEKNVEVSLPRFRLEYTKSLVSCFQRLGVVRAFRPGAQLGVASDSPDLAVSEILHKAVLKVNEKGSEAAAATEVIEQPLSSRFDRVFVADHPFAFVIYDSRSDLVLFMGRVNDL